MPNETVPAMPAFGGAPAPSRLAALKGGTLLALARALRPILHRLDERRQDRLMNRLVRPYLAWRPIGLDFTTPDGLRIQGHMRDVIVRDIFFRGVWEPPLRRLLEETLRPGDVFVDAGSNFGYFSLLASRLVGAEGSVFAIEASPSIYGRLQRHMRLNGAANVTCRNVAVSFRPGTLKVFLAGPANPGSTTTVEDEAELALRGAVPEAEVEALPLDRIVPPEALRRAALIKIDVEGAEAEVLSGLVPILGLLRQDAGIVVELNRRIMERAGQQAEAVLAPFRAAGFALFGLPDETGRVRPIADLGRAFNRWDTADVLLRRNAA